MAPISAGSPAKGSRSSRTRSATWPGAIVPASSRWFTQAEPEVYAAKAASRSRACCGRNASEPARPSSPWAHRLTATWIASSGSGELTGQSLPATRRAPDRCSAPNGYCHEARSSPR